MEFCDWQPFFKAAFERNPVSVELFRQKEIAEIYNELIAWPDESIYDGNRLALPDEVVNFKRGDGIEKAITLVNILKNRHIQKISLEQHEREIILHADHQKYVFKTGKSLKIGAINRS
jgi:DNA-binding protein